VAAVLLMVVAVFKDQNEPKELDLVVVQQLMVQL